MIVLIAIALVAGFVTAISPCVLPVLPVLLAGGATGRSPVRIIAGLVTSFVFFTLSATWLLGKLGLRDDRLRQLAILMLFLLAATLLVPQLGRLVERPFAGLTRYRAGGGGFLLGASLGLVFTPCAGPVLAAISVAAAEQRVGWRAITITIAYALGVAVPMALIAYGGKGLSVELRSHDLALRRTSGALIALMACAFAFNLDTRLATHVPGYVTSIQSWVENSSTAKKELALVNKSHTSLHAAATTTKTTTTPTQASVVALPRYGEAPPLQPAGDWFNSPPLTLAHLRGKVVLIDFWTYSCINCLRTLPHLESWYATYHRQGLEIIGVHTPEFAFEHVASNVRSAIARLGIRYPVVQDNNYGTFSAYGNNSWPAEYLIDRTGQVREIHPGEGQYGETEGAIRALLGDDGTMAKRVPDATPTEETTPETYLGFERLDATRYVGSAIKNNRLAAYRAPLAIPQNAFAYSGQWRVEQQRIVAGTNASIALHFVAKDVYLVLGGHGHVGVQIDGKQAPGIGVSSYKLYTIHSSKTLQDGRLDLSVPPGVQAYAFTFG